jgi:hypothetical protein
MPWKIIFEFSYETVIAMILFDLSAVTFLLVAVITPAWGADTRWAGDRRRWD